MKGLLSRQRMEGAPAGGSEGPLTGGNLNGQLRGWSFYLFYP